MPLAAFLSLAALLSLAACGGRTEGPSPRGLSYDDPDPNPATYAFTDSATFAIESVGYGVMEVETVWAGVAELQFRREYAGYNVLVRFPRFQGSFRNPAQGTSRTDESDIEGPVGIDLSFTGDMTVVDTPSLSPALRGVTSAEGLARPLFVRLPGRSVRPGDQWVDTVRTVEESAGTVSRGTTVITSTLAGDTVLDGRRLLRIATESAVTVAVTGISGGVEIEQRLDGALQGWLLWDDRSNILVERAETGELSGTLGMPGSGTPTMPILATVRRRMELRRLDP